MNLLLYDEKKKPMKGQEGPVHISNTVWHSFKSVFKHISFSQDLKLLQ